MSKFSKPAPLPTTTKGGSIPPSEPQKVSAAKQQFMAAALNMSWQLAVVVLLPIVGGFKLDEHFHSLPLWTISGFVLAMLGMAVVVWRQLQLFSPSAGTDTAKGHNS